MQVIIPLAGKGTRLRPHTHLVPKPLLKVAGRPVMDWVMDRLEGLDVTELIFITGHLKEQVEAVLDSLTGRERRVLQLRFGLEDGRSRTLEEVGRDFNVTRERIRQIEAKALRKLRHPSRSRKLKDYLE